MLLIEDVVDHPYLNLNLIRLKWNKRMTSRKEQTNKEDARKASATYFIQVMFKKRLRLVVRYMFHKSNAS